MQIWVKNPLLRKSISILLLVCFASYHFGYYVFYFSQEARIENVWHNKIYAIESIDLEERIMEIPFPLPYMPNQEDFSPTNTRFVKDGTYFRAIKERYQNDTLQVVYVLDSQRQALESTLQEWVSWLNQDDFQTEKPSSVPLKAFVKDYIETPLIDFVTFCEKIDQAEIGYPFFNPANPLVLVVTPPPQFSV